MDLKVLSALIGLCGAVSNNGKTENTDRVVLEAILSQEPEKAVQRIHEEKYRISPDCASCPTPCGNTSDGHLSRWNQAPEHIRRLKEEVMAGLERMAEARAKSMTEDLCRTQEPEVPEVVYRAISWLGYVSLNFELGEETGRELLEEIKL